MKITEFLLARITEAEEACEIASRETKVFGGFTERAAIEIRRNDQSLLWSTDMLRADCAAKRRIVERGPSECGGYEDQEQFDAHHYPDPEWAFCDGCSSAASSDADWQWTLRILALPYADHPDFREEWR